MKTTIICRLQLEGLHKWSKCPFEQVKFLRDEHRHIFWFECEKVVHHDDRDVEFIMFKREITKYLVDKYDDGECLKFNNMSCEMIAKELVEKYDLERCSVFEDNENGAVVYAEKKEKEST
jgi:hypothetical protein